MIKGNAIKQSVITTSWFSLSQAADLELCKTTVTVANQLVNTY